MYANNVMLRFIVPKISLNRIADGQVSTMKLSVQ